MIFFLWYFDQQTFYPRSLFTRKPEFICERPYVATFNARTHAFWISNAFFLSFSLPLLFFLSFNFYARENRRTGTKIFFSPPSAERFDREELFLRKMKMLQTCEEDNWLPDTVKNYRYFVEKDHATHIVSKFCFVQLSQFVFFKDDITSFSGW